MKILFAGGGTGGHIFPIIAVARELKRKCPPGKDLKLYFIGPKDEISDQIFEKEGIKVKKITTGKARRYPGASSIFQNFVDLAFKVPLGVIQSFFYIFFLSPDLIFSKGGHGAFPSTLAAKSLQVPIFLHESDISPGIANRKLSRFALEIFTSFNNTEFFSSEKMILVGNPVRKDLYGQNSKEEAEKSVGFKKNNPVILIMGGSQGSERVNDLALAIMPQLLSTCDVIHQCGLRNHKTIKAQSEFLISDKAKDRYHLFSFLTEDQLKGAYYLADLVISRAGSTSIFEIAAAGKPSILIPLPEAAQNHQVKNAYAYSGSGTAIVIEEENIKSNLFLQKIKEILGNPSLANRMSENAKEFSRPRSSEIIAEYLLEFLREV